MMLLLTRRIGESVIIHVSDQYIKIQLIAIETSNRVKLGFTANKQVNIVREEIDYESRLPVSK